MILKTWSEIYKSVSSGVLKKLSQELNVGFEEFRNSENGFSLFANPFAADLDNSLTEFSMTWYIFKRRGI